MSRQIQLRQFMGAAYIASLCALASLTNSAIISSAMAKEPAPIAILKTYSDIAHATYEDSFITAKSLAAAIDTLIAKPSAATLADARKAWLAARVPYQQSEAYRFGNPIVDDWEGKVNAWPLDEGLIDYVAGDYGNSSDENSLYVANVIANKSIKINGKEVDTSNITKTLIAETLQEAGGVEANVASGYHAIEFLPWGQDLNGTGKGAGNRPHTDFDTAQCTGGHCDRRAAYLKAVTDLLIDDLTFIVAQWAPQGAARKSIIAAGENDGLSRIFTGLGSLSYGELAGERIKLGLMLHDPEEEHDCFSDNTHNSHFYDGLGVQNVYLGTYKRIDGTVVTGASVSDLVRARNKDIDETVRADLTATMTAMSAMVKRAEGGEAYDQMIGEDNEAGNKLIQTVVSALVKQTKSIERAVAALGLKTIAFEGSDSLDAPANVK